MKTAILISGHLRTFDLCLPTLRWHLFRKYPDADFFVSTVRDEDSHKVGLIEDLNPRVQVVEEQPDCVDHIADVMGCERESVERFAAHAPYAISVPPQAILAQLWQLQECFNLIEIPEEYHTFIRVRPDIFIHSFAKPMLMADGEATTPWWGRFGGVNDRLAVMGPKAAAGYFGTYDATPGLLRDGCPLHPESLVKASVERGGCWTSPKLSAEFSKYGQTGKMIRFWGHEVLPCDTPPYC